MAFKFKLEKYLKLKKMEEDKVKIELGKKISIKNTKEEEMQNASREVIKNSEDKLMLLTKGISVAKLGAYFLSEDMAMPMRKRREKKLEEINQEVSSITSDFVKALGKVKSLENIKSKQQVIYNKDMNRKEQNELDELFNIRKNGKNL